MSDENALEVAHNTAGELLNWLDALYISSTRDHTSFIKEQSVVTGIGQQAGDDLLSDAMAFMVHYLFARNRISQLRSVAHQLTIARAPIGPAVFADGRTAACAIKRLIEFAHHCFNNFTLQSLDHICGDAMAGFVISHGGFEAIDRRSENNIAIWLAYATHEVRTGDEVLLDKLEDTGRDFHQQLMEDDWFADVISECNTDSVRAAVMMALTDEWPKIKNSLETRASGN